jgi:hypothetical protein
VTEDGDRIQSSEGCFEIKDRTMDNVQKVNNFNNSWLLLVGTPNENSSNKAKNLTPQFNLLSDFYLK